MILSYNTYAYCIFIYIHMYFSFLHTHIYRYQIRSDQISCSVVSDSLRPHESQHARPPCPSPTPGVYSDSCPSSQWCHPAISSSVIPFSSCPHSLPASESFPMSQLFAWGGQSTGVSALASLYPYTFFSTVIMALRLYAMNVHKRHDELARGFRIWRLILESWLCFIPVYLRCVSLLDVCFPFYKVGII